MSRISTMTIGFLMIFIGLQLNFVQTYVLTPKATQFWAERFETPESPANSNGYQTQNYNSVYAPSTRPFSNGPFQNAGYSTLTPRYIKAKEITPSDWLCWPVIFLGAVFVLHGAAVHRGP